MFSYAYQYFFGTGTSISSADGPEIFTPLSLESTDYLLVSVAAEGGVVPTGVTWAGYALAYNLTIGTLSIFELRVAPVGTGDVVVTFSTSTRCSVGVTILSHLKTQAIYDASTPSGPGSPAAVSLALGNSPDIILMYLVTTPEGNEFATQNNWDARVGAQVNLEGFDLYCVTYIAERSGDSYSTTETLYNDWAWSIVAYSFPNGTKIGGYTSYDLNRFSDGDPHSDRLPEEAVRSFHGDRRYQ